MKKHTKFPTEIQCIARQQRANAIELLHQEKEWSAYSLGWVDENGNPLPTGQPEFYQLFNNGKISTLSGEAAFVFLRKYCNNE